MASVIPTLQQRMLAIVARVYQNGQIVPFELHGMDEVRLFLAEIAHMQKQLRALKSEVQAEKKAMRLAYSAQRATIVHPFVELFGGKKRAITQTAQDRELLRQQEHTQAAVYDNGIRAIDSLIRLLDGVKLEVQRQKVQQTSKQQ